MSKYKLGLVNVLMGDIAPDGGAGSVLLAVGDTVTDSAKMDTQDATIQDFTIEESSSPVLSIKTSADKITITWSTYNNDVDVLVKFFGGTKVAAGSGAVSTLGTITGGTGYVNGTYYDVPVTGGVGTGFTADIVVAGGIVTVVTIRKAGKNYTTVGTYSATAANLGGSGSGFTFPVTAVASFQEYWQAPDAIPEVEKTVRLDWKQGGYVLAPRTKINAKLAYSFKKSGLSQIDITATILQPTKSGEPRLVIVNG